MTTKQILDLMLWIRLKIIIKTIYQLLPTNQMAICRRRLSPVIKIKITDDFYCGEAWSTVPYLQQSEEFFWLLLTIDYKPTISIFLSIFKKKLIEKTEAIDLENVGCNRGKDTN